MEDTIKVLTGKSIQFMEDEGGCGFWKLGRDRAIRCQYVVAVRNRQSEFCEDEVEHGAAFMVGRISGIEQSRNDDRWIIKISEYAEINLPSQWDGSRNPITYTSLAELGVNPQGLEWHDFFNGETITAHEAIQNAKESIAKLLGLPIENIEILVKF